MASIPAKTRQDMRGAFVAKIKVARVRRLKITFGDVTVVGPRPSAVEVKRNIEASRQALERVKARLMRPGVRLYAKKGVPLYSADPDRPGVYIRQLNGKTDRGILENGAFKVTD